MAIRLEHHLTLRFVYTPARDVAAAAAFYRDALGWAESWRDGPDTVAFSIPDSDGIEVLVSSGDLPAGPMHLVHDLGHFLADHPDLPRTIGPRDVHGGQMVGVQDPAGNTVYFFDQAG